MLSKQAFDEFKAIYKQKYGEGIDEEELFTLACSLLAGVDAIYHPIKKEWLDEYNNSKSLSKESSLES